MLVPMMSSFLLRAWESQQEAVFRYRSVLGAVACRSSQLWVIIEYDILSLIIALCYCLVANCYVVVVLGPLGGLLLFVVSWLNVACCANRSPAVWSVGAV